MEQTSGEDDGGWKVVVSQKTKNDAKLATKLAASISLERAQRLARHQAFMAAWNQHERIPCLLRSLRYRIQCMQESITAIGPFMAGERVHDRQLPQAVVDLWGIRECYEDNHRLRDGRVDDDILLVHEGKRMDQSLLTPEQSTVLRDGLAVVQSFMQAQVQVRAIYKQSVRDVMSWFEAQPIAKDASRLFWTADDGSSIVRVSTIASILNNGVMPTQAERWELGGVVMNWVFIHREQPCDGKVEITENGETWEVNAYRASHLRSLVLAILPWVAEHRK